MASDGTIKISTELDNANLQKALTKFGKIVKTGIAALSISKITSEVASLGSYVFQTGMQFESSFAGVKKTVNATDSELQEFRNDIRTLSTEIPQTASAIADVAESAGQLGIKNAYLMDFTETMSNLGVATNMSATEAATSLARLANITQMPQENFGQLGSTVVALGNKLATTESEITEMGLRLAGAGEQVGMTEAQILGLAGALSSVGIEADAGGSAVSTAMAKMQLAVEQGGESLEQFASVAGMSAEEFQQAFKEDAAQALVAFVTGLSTMEERGQSAIATLDNMEITEIRQRDALLRLSGAGDILSESLGIATKAWDENNALTKEAEQRYETLESRLQILKNDVDDFGISVYDSMSEPIKNTVNESIVYVDRLHNAFKSGGLNAAVKELGEVFDDVTDDIAGTSEAAAGVIIPLKNIVNTGASLASGVLPAVAEGFQFTAENLDFLLPALTAITVGFKAFNVIGKTTAASTKANAAAVEILTKMEKKNALQLVATNGGLTLRQTLLAVQNGQITLATALTGLWTKAQVALNTALSANPLGAIVAMMVVFLGVGKAIESVVTKQTAAEREHSKALKESKQAAEENLLAAQERTQAYEELVQSQNEQAASDVAQLDRLRSLNDELNTIVDANGKVKAGEEERAAFITSQLSSALGIEISMTDNQISNYQELHAEIQNLIEQKRIDAVMSAQQAKYEEAVAKQMEVAAEASKNLTAMKEAELAVEKERAELASLEADRNQAVIDGNKALVKILDEKIKKQQEDVDEAEEYLASSSEAYTENTKLLEKYANDIDLYTALAEAAATGNAEAIESAINQITAGIKTASNATQEELQNQVIGVANTEEMIRQEVENGTPGFTEAMLTQAQSATTAALEEFAKAAPQTADELSKVPAEAVAALIAGDMKGQLSAEASGSVQGMLNAISGMSEGSRNAILSLLKPMLTESQYAAIEMEINGQEAGEQYSSGVESQRSAAEGAGKSLASSADTGAKSVDGSAAGSNFGSGFVSGIGGWIRSAATKAAELANTALGAAQRALDSHSPSRKARKLGKTVPQGLGLGVEDDAKKAIGPTEDLAENMLDAINPDELSELMKGIDVSSVMAKVYAVVEDKQDHVAEKVVSVVAANEDLSWRNREMIQKTTMSDEDIEKLAKEFAIVASEKLVKELDGMGIYARDREIARLVREVK